MQVGLYSELARRRCRRGARADRRARLSAHCGGYPTLPRRHRGRRGFAFEISEPARTISSPSASVATCYSTCRSTASHCRRSSRSSRRTFWNFAAFCSNSLTHHRFAARFPHAGQPALDLDCWHAFEIDAPGHVCRHVSVFGAQARRAPAIMTRRDRSDKADYFRPPAPAHQPRPERRSC